jgi:hypothetical protein
LETDAATTTTYGVVGENVNVSGIWALLRSKTL